MKKLQFDSLGLILYSNLSAKGNLMDYTYDKGFCRHMIGNEGDQESAICIKLAQQTILNNIRLLLWDKDDRNVQDKCSELYI